jgi:xanthine dehydrogenase accessory factor
LIDFIKALTDLNEIGDQGVLCTIVSSQGSTPRHAGSKLLLYQDGHFIGSVGGGEIEHRVIIEALSAMVDGKTKLVRYDMIDPSEGDPGICGGTIEVFIEPYIPGPVLLIIGGGHVGKAVAHLGHWLGFRIVISDDRPEFCTKEANPDADNFVCAKMEDVTSQYKITPHTYVALTTRGMPVDIKALPELLKSPAAYIGLIGSKRRWLLTRKSLIDTGVSEDLINRIHVPIGLELNAETPEEIAVSIMAEILMIKNNGSGKIMKM